MVKRTLNFTESVAFELDNLATEKNCDLETLILTNLSKAYNRFGFARKDCIRRKECAPCFRRLNRFLFLKKNLEYSPTHEYYI